MTVNPRLPLTDDEQPGLQRQGDRGVRGKAGFNKVPVVVMVPTRNRPPRCASHGS
jgi:hypothetical protein